MGRIHNNFPSKFSCLIHVDLSHSSEVRFFANIADMRWEIIEGSEIVWSPILTALLPICILSQDAVLL